LASDEVRREPLLKHLKPQRRQRALKERHGHAARARRFAVREDAGRVHHSLKGKG
jgi:hypothetical protein